MNQEELAHNKEYMRGTLAFGQRHIPGTLCARQGAALFRK